MPDEEIVSIPAIDSFVADISEKRTSKHTYQGAPDHTVVEDTRETRDVFLTIAMRTVGARPQAFQQALAALEKQTDDSFELIVVLHNHSEKADSIRAILQQHSLLQGKWALVCVEGGSRSRPLNVAASLARGQYYVAHDDDDLAFEHYVSQFHQGSLEHPGAILYSYVYSQAWVDDAYEPYAIGGLDCVFCADAVLGELIFNNHCPNLGLAFPLSVFTRLDCWYDEQLNVTEDWDFLTRCMMEYGIASLPTPSSIYRRWNSGKTSLLEYGLDEWEKTAQDIYRKIDERYLLLPPGTYKFLRELNAQGAFDRQQYSDSAIYPDDGSGFFEFTKLKPDDVQRKDEVWTLRYTINASENNQTLRAIRFDPGEKGGIVVRNFSMQLVCKNELNEEALTIKLDDCWTNGVVVEESAVFLKRDPQIVYEFTSPQSVSEVIVSFGLSNEVPDDLIDAAFCKYAEGANEQKKKHRFLFGRRS